MRLPSCLLAGAAVSLLAACSGGNGSSSATASPAPSPAASVVVAASPTLAGSSAPTATPAVPVQQVSFTDISGDFGQPQIQDEAALGILDSAGGAFKPYAPITRAQFVRWLVKAENIYFKDAVSKQIRLAKTGPAQFVDVPVGSPDFPYIQGLANSGYVIGIDKKHFAPNRVLTREELIAIKAPVDEGGNIQPYPGVESFLSFSDTSKINPQYATAVHEDESVRTTRNIARIWGALKTFSPKKPVTRSEAAIAIWEINDGSAAVALGRSAPPPPK
ncbi:MAG TPA: S-layer homology domain-containing protein [Candidatus Rubrimentiphilum sp.]|nr:S-layer homology domain-containing protein [Candidatus Rubrimentiphilum sp.]